MPYIAQKDRPAFNVHIDALADEINKCAESYGYDGAFAGLLNYSCTRLALKVMPARRYWAIAIVSGVFHNIADEFARRYTAPYEDEQIAKNGDVY
jgi:Domain of unknown function (DUF6899)